MQGDRALCCYAVQWSYALEREASTGHGMHLLSYIIYRAILMPWVSLVNWRQCSSADFLSVLFPFHCRYERFLRLTHYKWRFSSFVLPAYTTTGCFTFFLVFLAYLHESDSLVSLTDWKHALAWVACQLTFGFRHPVGLALLIANSLKVE